MCRELGNATPGKPPSPSPVPETQERPHASSWTHSMDDILGQRLTDLVDICRPGIDAVSILARNEKAWWAFLLESPPLRSGKRQGDLGPD